jgi:hypothetical protein
MKMAVQQEDIKLLSDVLQERLVAEFPSVEGLQAKCVLQNEELMVLIQHPPDQVIDTERTFIVLEQVLQWQLSYSVEGIRCFVRITGEKLPYAKCSLNIYPRQQPEQPDASLIEEEYQDDENNFQPLDSPDLISHEAAIQSYNPFFSATEFSESPEFQMESAESIPEEKFDPFAGGPDLRDTKKSRFPRLPQFSTLPSSPIFWSIAIGVFVIGCASLGAGAYYLTNSCLVFKCKELETAENLHNNLSTSLRHAKSDKQLQLIEEQIEAATPTLANIPEWSPNHQLAVELTNSFSAESSKIQQVVAAIKKAAQAIQKGQSTLYSTQDLKNQQDLWQQSVTLLEKIKPTDDLYTLVYPLLPEYRQRLASIDRMYLQEESLQKKLTLVQEIAKTAQEKQNSAKSLGDWQKVVHSWEVVINALKRVPTTSAEYNNAQSLITKYQPQFTTASNRANKELFAHDFYQKAMRLANQAKTYQQKTQLQLAVTAWRQAIDVIKQVPEDSSIYKQAQTLATSYSSSLAQAQTESRNLASSVNQARADLIATCNSGTQICTFTIDNDKIVVRLSQIYDQALQNTSDTNIQSHFEKLREALKVISENANLSLSLLNSQGGVMYERIQSSN